MALERDNFVMPAGKVYFNPLLPNGNYDGERYLGDTPGFSISVETERVQFFSSDSKTREKLRDIVVEINRSAEITCRDITAENMAIFLAGDVASLAQTSGTVTDEAIGEVKQGRFYQIGESTAFPAGARLVSAVTVKVGADVKDLDDDYTVDLDLGRIYIVEDGDIDNGDSVLVTYTKAAASIQEIKSGDTASRKGKLRYVANNREGTNKDLLLPSVDLGPSGALELKGDDWQEVGFTCEVLKPLVGAAIYINSRAVV